MGAPATAKSMLLRWVAGLPLGNVICASGSSSTAAGLTVAVGRASSHDAEQSAMRPGALVQAGTGIVCLDELDQMQEPVQSSMREAMEFQSISVAKAGIVTKLTVGCSVLAAWSLPTALKRSGSGEFAGELPTSPLLDCFDAVTVVEEDPQGDAKLAAHLVALTRGSAQMRRPSSMSPSAAATSEQLVGLMRLARSRTPELSAAASEALSGRYVDLRRLRAGASPKTLESMVRLSQAVARTELEDEVGADHVDKVVDLLRDSYLPAQRLREEQRVWEKRKRPRF